MDAAPFAGLLEDHATTAKVYLAIENAVAKSFKTDDNRIIAPRASRVTQSEIKRRTEKCIEIFRVLRGDLGWSWMRACDHLGTYLRKALDGVSWEPEGERTMWTPNANIE